VTAAPPPELVIFCGIQATGKSTFFQRRLFHSHVRIGLDLVRTRHREATLFDACLRCGQSVVIDNTSPTPAERARYIAPARAAGFVVVGYYFQSRVAPALARNAGRPEDLRVPDRGTGVPNPPLRARLRRSSWPRSSPDGATRARQQFRRWRCRAIERGLVASDMSTVCGHHEVQVRILYADGARPQTLRSSHRGDARISHAIVPLVVGNMLHDLNVSHLDEAADVTPMEMAQRKLDLPLAAPATLEVIDALRRTNALKVHLPEPTCLCLVWGCPRLACFKLSLRIGDLDCASHKLGCAHSCAAFIRRPWVEDGFDSVLTVLNQHQIDDVTKLRRINAIDGSQSKGWDDDHSNTEEGTSELLGIDSHTESFTDDEPDRP
jgi:hypothetical protein